MHTPHLSQLSDKNKDEGSFYKVGYSLGQFFNSSY